MGGQQRLEESRDVCAPAGVFGGAGEPGTADTTYRSFFLDEIGQDYVRTARAKGVTENAILFKHVLRNAMIPILTNVATSLPGVFIGSFLIKCSSPFQGWGVKFWWR